MDQNIRNDTQAKVIHREIVQLLQLGVLAVAAFFLTRALAESNRATIRRNGVEWYERGTRLRASGDLEPAVEALRRAAQADRHESKYVLALADALAGLHQYEAARPVLLALRESVPDDPQVNLQLARLAAARQDVTEAVRFYQNTLYAPWPRAADERRRHVRLELIDFLLGHDQAANAIPELIALSSEIPDEASEHVALATRFERAGDRRNALLQFQRALRRSPQDPAILAGAGQIAFELGDYLLARRYFRGVPAGTPGLAESRQLVDLIIAMDPLAPRLGAAERKRRLAVNLTYAQSRADECASAPPGSPDADLRDLRRRARLFETALRSRSASDMDTIEEGVELTEQLEVAASRHCVPALRDRALVIIAQRHAADRR